MGISRPSSSACCPATPASAWHFIILIALRMLQGLALERRVQRRGHLQWPNTRHMANAAPTSWIQTAAAGPVPVAARDPRLTVMGEPAFNDWGWRIPSWCHPAAGPSRCGSIVSLSNRPPSEDEGRGQDPPRPAVRILRPVEEPEDRDPGADHGLTAGEYWSGYGPVLRAVLPDAAAQGRCRHGQPDDRRGPADRHAFLRGVFGPCPTRSAASPSSCWAACWPCFDHFLVFKALTGAANPDLAKAQATAGVFRPPTPPPAPSRANPVARDDFKSSCDIAKRYLVQNP